jgi:hypothetical protein
LRDDEFVSRREYEKLAEMYEMVREQQFKLTEEIQRQARELDGFRDTKSIRKKPDETRMHVPSKPQKGLAWEKKGNNVFKGRRVKLASVHEADQETRDPPSLPRAKSFRGVSARSNESSRPVSDEIKASRTSRPASHNPSIAKKPPSFGGVARGLAPKRNGKNETFEREVVAGQRRKNNKEIEEPSKGFEYLRKNIKKEPHVVNGFSKLKNSNAGPVVVSYEDETRADGSSYTQREDEYVGSHEVDKISEDQLDRLLIKARSARH